MDIEEKEDFILSKKTCRTMIFSIVFMTLIALAAFGISLYLIITKTGETKATSFVILHFSDFYQIDGITTGNYTIGGIARLATIVKQQTLPTIITFGGDCFSPSAMTTFLGAPTQMIETFNYLNTLAPVIAVAGNHEYDKPEMASEYMSKFTFPWLLANLFVPGTNRTLNGTQATHITTVAGVKIGFIGLGFDYRTVTALSVEEASYTDFLVVGEKLARKLKYEDKVDLVIALTHLSLTDDDKLMTNIPSIDLCLGGHDHIFLQQIINGKLFIEGDIDLRTLSVIHVSAIPETRPFIRQIEYDYIVPDSNTTAVDPTMDAIVDKFDDLFVKEGSIVVGATSVDLDCEKNSIRSIETNVGDYVSDVSRKWAQEILPNIPGFLSRPDANSPVISLINGGTLRWARTIPAGSNLTKGDVLNLVPFQNYMVVAALNGSILRSLLENSVSQLPNPEGRFLQVSGLRFNHTCNVTAVPPFCTTPAGSRVLTITLNNGTVITPEMTLFGVCPDFLTGGGDGYDIAKSLELVIDSENAELVLTIVLNALKVDTPISPKVDGRIQQTGSLPFSLFNYSPFEHNSLLSLQWKKK